MKPFDIPQVQIVERNYQNTLKQLIDKYNMITRVSLDDWEGYYLNGTLIAQNHSVDTTEILEKAGHKVESIYIENDDLDEFGNSLPDTIQELEDYLAKKK